MPAKLEGVNGAWLRIPPETKVETRTTWTIAVSDDQHRLGTAMIFLNRPCESVADLTAAEWMDLHTHLQRIHRALAQLLGPDGYEHSFHISGARQVYMRVVPRYRSARTWRGETFDDCHDGHTLPAGERPLAAESLAELRDAIRDRLPAVV